MNGRTSGSFGPSAAAIVDSFGQAPVTTGIGLADTGQSWTATAGVWGTNGGAYPVSGTNPIATVNATANGTLAFTMPVAQAGMGAVFRLSDSTHYWKITADPAAGTWTLAKVGGTAVAPVTSYSGLCCKRNDQIAVHMSGPSIAVSVGGVPMALVTDPDYTANTRHGLIAPSAGSGRIGSFSIDTAGSRSLNGYDENGNPRWSIDGSNHMTAADWDANNQPVTEYRGDFTTISNSFDANGRLTGYTSKDPGNNPVTTSYSYDAQNRLTSEDPAGPIAATTYSYAYSPGGSPGGETATATQPGGGTTTATFDAAGRIAGLNYSDATPDVTFGYDNNGRRTSMTRTGASASTWVYDNLGRMTSSTRAGRTVGYGYDLGGNNTTIQYPGSQTVTRHFDDASRLDSVTDWNSAAVTFGYDANSNLTTTNFPNGVTTTRTYDREDRPTNIAVTNGATTLGAWAQTFDNDSFVTAIAATSVGTNQTYSYNALDQLATNNSNTFTFDPADNLTQLDNTTRQKFNNSNQICWQTSAWTPTGDYANPCGTTPGWSNSYTFDARGNRTATAFPFATTKTHTYDLANRLTTYTQGAGTNANYIYDGDGLRLAKTVNGTDTTYTWDENGGLPLLLTDGTDKYLYGPQGEPIARIPASGTTTYIHQDHLGSTRLLTNNTGTTAGTYTYNPYGTTQSHTGVSVNLQYAGQYTDAETGYQYLRARYLDPATGQFATQDPLAMLTRDSFGYSTQNPSTFTDPSGLWPWDDVCVDGGALPFVDENPDCETRREKAGGTGEAVVDMVQNDPGQFATIVAGSTCVVLTLGVCGPALAGAWATRSAERYDEGDPNWLRHSIVDGLVTYFAFALLAVPAAGAAGALYADDAAQAVVGPLGEFIAGLPGFIVDFCVDPDDA